jgi:hypothetical protein
MIINSADRGTVAFFTDAYDLSNYTILNCLGIDHTRLTYFYQGRHHRLTDVSGEVVKGILA